MIPHTLAGLVPWVTANGYLLFFIATILEGALVTTAAGVVAGLGSFNLFYVVLISIAGDAVGDVVYYLIGRSSHKILYSRFFRFLGANTARVKEFERLIHAHTNKALVFIKLSPLVGPLGLISVGTVRVPFQKFIKTALVITVIKSLFFGLLGFFSAKSYLEINNLINHGPYIIGIIVLIIIAINILYRRFVSDLAGKFKP